MLGIENIKIMLVFVFTALNSALSIDSNQDGELSFSEVFSTITTISFKFPELQKSFPQLRKEFKDLNDEELQELVEHVNQVLDLPIRLDNIEDFIKRTINMLHYNYRYVKDVPDFFKKQDELTA